MPPKSFLAHAAATAAVALCLRGTAVAQGLPGGEDFYRGSVVTVVIGAPAGSTDDAYARLLARHLGKFIPGSPQVVIATATGSRAAAAQVAAGPKDGSVIAAVRADAVSGALWSEPDKLQQDLARFAYLGSANSDSHGCFMHADTPVKTMRDALAGEVVLGATRERGSTHDGPALLNNLVGTRFRLRANYMGAREILAAMEKGEVAGVCGMGWDTLLLHRPDWIVKGIARALIQESATGHVLGNKLGVPLAIDFARSANDREIMVLAYSPQALAHPYIVHPDTAPERVAQLRAAFAAALANKTVQAEAKTARLDINPRGGDEVQSLVSRLSGSPLYLRERVRDALTYRPPK